MNSIEQTLPRPTTQFRRREWLELQRALDPLAPPKPLSAVIRESDSSLPSNSRLSNSAGETA